MFAFIALFSVLSVFGANVEGSCDVEGYYWRDFYGAVPGDALPGGTHIDGKPTYIGQVLNSQRLIPAKIYSTDYRAFYELGGNENIATQNIKILCTQTPQNFEWIQTSNEDIKLLTDKHLVLGGYEADSTTYIGRVRKGGEILIGKALADGSSDNAGLHVTKDGRASRYTSFDVLAYNPYNVQSNAVSKL